MREQRITIKFTREQHETLILKNVVWVLKVRGEISHHDMELIRYHRLRNYVLHISNNFYKNGLSYLRKIDVLKKDTLPKDKFPNLVLGAPGIIYNFIRMFFALKIKVKHLTEGKTVKSKNIGQILEAQYEIEECAKDLQYLLEEMKTFDGREILYEVKDE